MSRIEQTGDSAVTSPAPQMPAPLLWRGLAVYLALAFGLSWMAQIGLAFALRHELGGALAVLGGGVLVVAVFLMWPPAIGAYIARRWVEGGNVADAGLCWPAWRFVALAWLGPPVLTALTMLVSLPLYPFDPTFTLLRELAARSGRPLPAPPEVLVVGQLFFALTLAVPVNALFAFGEEFGWRGYLLPRLIQALGPWPGLLAHGAIWGFWHAPLILLTGFNYPAHPVLGVPLFVVSGVLMGVLFGWLRLASESVVPPTIAHASLNAIGGAPLLVLRGVDPAVAGVIYSPVGWAILLLAIAVLLRSGALGRVLQSAWAPAG
jgi:membrane protease YdiL (CAAX protease family)